MRRLVAVLPPLLVSSFLSATHIIAGDLTYRHVDTINGQPNHAYTYIFTITTYTDVNNIAPVDPLYVDIHYVNDPTLIASIVAPMINGPTGEYIGNDIRKNIYVTGYYTFAGPGMFTAGVLDINRINGISNMEGSVNVPFYLEDTVCIGPVHFTGHNSSPVLLELAVVFTACCRKLVHNPAAYDPDGDSLVFSLMNSLQGIGTPANGYSWPDDVQHESCAPPNELTINPSTGELVWNVCQSQGRYNVGILVTQYRDGQKCGTMMRDMHIVVTCDDNDPPELSEVRDTCIVAGELLRLEVTASDQDPLQSVTIKAFGGPLELNNNPATFTAGSSNNPVLGIFEWQTICDHVRPQFYSVVFRAEDDSDPPYDDVKTWIIRVVAPPPTGLTAVANGNQVDLSWDSPYSCEGASKFRGFAVWRKAGCDSLTLDTCFTGIGALGYQKVSGLISGYSYTDTDVKRGLIYSYRVVAEFAETSPAGPPYYYNAVSGLPSSEACIELLKNVPIITHVDVTETALNAGVIEVRWVKPFADDLDTVQNHGPYMYELYRDIGLSAGSSPLLIQTFQSATFAGMDESTFTDSVLNTEGTPYNYLLGFWATDDQGNFYEIGKSDNASSVFLNVAVGGNLTLTWDEDVPWFNFGYEVLKETPTGSNTFVPLDTVTQQTFTDFSVIIGETYCYKIRSYGSYYNPAIEPDTLINHSQLACAIPIDTIAPCPPELTVTNGCTGDPGPINLNDLKNILTWNNPNHTCADDVMRYNVYYRSTTSVSFAVIATLNTAEDTTYAHGQLEMLAGCYAVTAIDSFDNESEMSNIVCVDNCPLYELPNVFTPNNDGDNEWFIPFPYRFIDHIDIRIFTRSGSLVYRTNDPDIRWNGTDQRSGRELKEGVYYYVCDVYESRVDGVRRQSPPLSGFIHIIR